MTRPEPPDVQDTPPSHLRLRDARAEDLEAVAGLVRSAYAEYERLMTPSAWEGLSSALEGGLRSATDAEVIVAEAGRKLAGCAFLFPPESGAYSGAAGESGCPEIRLVSVSPAARGLGIGRALLEECIRRARFRGNREIGLHTSRSMAAAVSLYRDLGFERRPELDFQPPAAELVEGYRLPLAPAGPPPRSDDADSEFASGRSGDTS
jgi:ribosomal protein S18 acetylase RimI-like enzyme